MRAELLRHGKWTHAVEDERLIVFVVHHLVLESRIDLFRGGVAWYTKEAVGVVAA